MQQDNTDGTQPTFITNPRIAAHGEWVGGEFIPDTPFHKISKEEREAKRKAEWHAMHKERARLAVRMKIGKDWDGKADNDNINWPLATSLVREGNTELLKAAMAYRRLHDQANSGSVLGGSSAPLGKGMSLDQRTHITANGNIAYKGVRTVETSEPERAATMKVQPYRVEDDGEERNVAKIPKPWNGDQPVNDRIDAQAKLDGLRYRLGVLVEPLEMAVIDGATYQAIGNSLGVANRAGAIGAGCAAVHMGLIAVRDMLGHVSRKDLAA